MEGMIANDNFIQSISNILQIKIIKPQNIETTALGGAYLAGLKFWNYKRFKINKEIWKSKKILFSKIKKNKLIKNIKMERNC